MKILQLCKKFPYPLKDGESVAVTFLARALRDLGCSITLLAMNTSKHYIAPEEIPSGFDHYESIHLVDLDNRIYPGKALQNLMGSESYHVERYISTEFIEKLAELLKTGEFDIVQMETLYLSPYIQTIRNNSNALISMRSHNVEFEIWERICSNTANPLKSWYLKLQTARLKKYETGVLNNYDLFVAITERDLTRFQSLGLKLRSMALPVGLDMESYQPTQEEFAKERSLCFIGSLDWMPNVEGLLWFLDQIWPDIHEKYPEIKFHIAGRNTPDWMFGKKWKNVVIHGEVDDAAEFLNAYPILIVPLLSGSGMRIKILEAMALGRCVISTGIGLEGIPAESGREVLIADNPAEFLNAIDICVNQRSRASEIGETARDFVESRFDNKQIAKELIQFYQNKPVPA